jgi:single-strand DNA-binding protein
MNVNKVILVGRLTRDPEIRTTPTGQSVATISMATNSFWTDKSGQKQDKTEFHNVVLWGRQAEIASQYLTKGQECFIEGRLQTRAYTGKDGVERRTTEVIAESMQLGSRAQGSGGSAERAPRPVAAASAAGGAKAASTPLEEEIPTINLDDDSEEIRIEDVPF